MPYDKPPKLRLIKGKVSKKRPSETPPTDVSHYLTMSERVERLEHTMETSNKLILEIAKVLKSHQEAIVTLTKAVNEVRAKG
jgi:hypothetical protein